MTIEKKVLLHVCCANCATACIEMLKGADYEVALFFTNSNIDTEEEFKKRLKDTRHLAHHTGLVLYEDRYKHDIWLKTVEGLEDEPEKGKRCRKCFEFNLMRVAEKAGELGFPSFTTTLTVSPHKTSKVIFEIGQYLKGFLPVDFKKQNGFQRSLELSKQHDFYRQDYCGCEFSRK
jgi:predicted adenine nucleotide alpha hydrolase (AANH) superfamily ATPase